MKNLKKFTAIAAAALLSMNLAATSVSADWVEKDGKTYYTTSSGKKATGLKKIDGEKYYFRKDGSMATGWVKIKGEKYYFDSEGVMTTGNAVIGDYIYGFTSSGKMSKQYKNTLVKVDGKIYMVNKSGKITKGFKKVGSNYYYFGTKGYAIDKEYEYNGYLYVLDAEEGLVEKTKLKVKPESIKIKEGPFVNSTVKLIDFTIENNPDGDTVYFKGSIKNTATNSGTVKARVKMTFMDENGKQVGVHTFTTKYLALSDLYEFDSYDSVSGPVYKVNFTVTII
ncbi:MAG: hypothetical protein IJ446_04300 [Oscillospiraceae bacterium]|nr:hypothetical protein [Oscillospiraceae bacterium]